MRPHPTTWSADQAMDRGKILAEVERLIELSIRYCVEEPELARNALEHAWKLCIHTDTPVPKKLRLLRCKKCGSPHIPGYSVKVRLVDGWVVWYPSNCNHIKQIRYK